MYPSNAILKVNFKQKRSFVTQEEDGECCQNSLRNWKGKTTSICRHCSSVSCLKKRAILQLFLPSLNPISTAAHQFRVADNVRTRLLTPDISVPRIWVGYVIFIVVRCLNYFLWILIICREGTSGRRGVGNSPLNRELQPV